jgi:hypothetical protein
MVFYTEIPTTLFNIIKSSIFFFRHRFILFIRLIILLIIFVSLLYFSSIHYYSFYCTNRFQDGLIEANKRDLWDTINGVLIPVCDRPHYLKRVLDGLTKVDGINEVKTN